MRSMLRTPWRGPRRFPSDRRPSPSQGRSAGRLAPRSLGVPVRDVTAVDEVDHPGEREVVDAIVGLCVRVV